MLDGDRVLVDHAVEGVGLVLHRHPVLQGAQVVADMKLAGRLDSAEDAALALSHVGLSDSGTKCPEDADSGHRPVGRRNVAEPETPSKRASR